MISAVVDVKRFRGENQMDNRRDYFAGLAMQGLLRIRFDASDLARISTEAYQVADAMLTARSEFLEHGQSRIDALEKRVAWAATEFEAIANSIANNSVGAAQAHAQACAAEMDPED